MRKDKYVRQNKKQTSILIDIHSIRRQLEATMDFNGRILTNICAFVLLLLLLLLMMMMMGNKETRATEQRRKRKKSWVTL
jgi:hypothetical protein